MTNYSKDHSSRKKLNILMLCIISLVLLFVTAKVLFVRSLISEGVFNFFHLDRETNLPTWFSCTQLSLAGILCLRNFRNTPTKSKLALFFWFSYFLVLMIMSIDEFAQIHELFDRQLILGVKLEHRWVLYFLPPVIILGTVYVLIMFSIFKAHKDVLSLLIIGGVVFLTGAMGVEMLKPVIFSNSTLNSIPGILSIQVIVEEFMEMAGVALQLYAIDLFHKKTITKQTQ